MFSPLMDKKIKKCTIFANKKLLSEFIKNLNKKVLQPECKKKILKTSNLFGNLTLLVLISNKLRFWNNILKTQTHGIISKKLANGLLILSIFEDQNFPQQINITWFFLLYFITLPIFLLSDLIFFCWNFPFLYEFDWRFYF